MRYLFFLVLIILSCKKAEDRSCLKFTGEQIEKRIDLADFERLDLGPYLNFRLVQDTVQYVRLFGGENVVNHVKTEVTSNKELVISNENKCRFLRNSNKTILVEIHFVDLKDVFFEGSGWLKNEGQLDVPELTVTLSEGSGTATLHVKTTKLNVAAEPSWSNYILTGQTEEARLSVKGNAYGDSKGLKINSSLTVISRSSADLVVNVDGTGTFKCETWGNGNVYYSGVPSWLHWNDYGKGKLLPAN